jgi:type I restriction-modification system DNA methylase subunit
MSTKPRPGDFRKILESLSHKHDTRRVFEGFTRLSACALGMGTREPEYLEEAKHWEKPELEMFSEALATLIMEMEAHPFEDVIGGYYMEAALSKKGQQWNGEFHTPKHICDLIARMLVNAESLPKEGLITVCEPACGAGAMILSLGQILATDVRRRLRVTAIDINRTACDMAFINTTLWSIPTRVIHGNTLSMEYWTAWSNLFYGISWLTLGVKGPPPETSPQGKPPHSAEVERIRASLLQQELKLI